MIKNRKENLKGATARLPLTLHHGRFPREDVADNRPYTNPYELLATGQEAALRPLLVASAPVTGVELGEADADYDKFAALCAAAPCWAGHPLYAAMHGVLAKVTGCTLPMTAANAPLIWRYYTAETVASPLGVREALARLGVGRLYLGITLDEWSDAFAGTWKTGDDGITVTPMLCLDDPAASSHPDILSYTAALTAAVHDCAARGGTRVLACLPDGWHFTRPHPFGANEVMKKMAAGQTVTPDEGHLLRTQICRVLGQACANAGVELALCGGTSVEVARLVAYLMSCDGHSALRYTPSVAGEVRGLLGTPGVSFGLPLTTVDTPDSIKGKIAAHAAVAPIGALAGADLPVHSLTDVWTLIEARRALCTWLADGNETGAAPRDVEALRATLARM